MFCFQRDTFASLNWKQFRKRREDNIQQLKDAEETITNEIQRILLRYKLKHDCEVNCNASHRAVTQMLSSRMLALTVRAYARMEKQARLNQAWLQKQERWWGLNVLWYEAVWMLYAFFAFTIAKILDPWPTLAKSPRWKRSAGRACASHCLVCTLRMKLMERLESSSFPIQHRNCTDVVIVSRLWAVRCW